VLIVVPAFNEQGNVGRTVSEVRQQHPSAHIVVIDDGSLDHTAREAESAGAHVVSLPFNLGIGGAVQTGFRYAHDHGYDVAVQVDGDGQHNVAYLKALMQPILDGKADMTIGSRFADRQSGGFKSSFARRIGISFFAWLISLLTRYRVSDPTSGFRAYNRLMISVFARQYPHDFPEPEAVVVASRHGARVVEVPVAMRERAAGRSSIRRLGSVYYMVKVTFAMLLHMIRDKKLLSDYAD
jgi:glycosyltransferase involved in cell wall biosynthesis